MLYVWSFDELDDDSPDYQFLSYNARTHLNGQMLRGERNAKASYKARLAREANRLRQSSPQR